jgi:hypothetical protein
MNGEGGIPQVLGDGRQLPFPDQCFDVAFCNSVIEHLGSRENQKRLADEIRRVARQYFVQTPNYWFPIEPHFLTPCVQFFPVPTREKLIRNFTVWGWVTRPSPESCRAIVQEIQLLKPAELRAMFPEAELIVERFMLFPKSLIAVRR